MKPYAPYKEEAFLIETEPGQYSVSFRGVHYRATTDLTALGVLLFGLRASGLNFRTLRDIETGMHLIQQAAYILHLHANGDRWGADGIRWITADELSHWMNSAVELAPTPDSAKFVLGCVYAALGPYAFLSDEHYSLRKKKQRK